MSITTRDELIGAAGERYGQRGPEERGHILDQFVAVMGYHRKHATRLVRGGRPHSRSGARPGRRVYDAAAREALIVRWEAADRICGRRLKALLPVPVEAMEWHRHLRLALEVRDGLLVMSAATIDRSLREVRARVERRARTCQNQTDAANSLAASAAARISTTLTDVTHSELTGVIAEDH